MDTSDRRTFPEVDRFVRRSPRRCRWTSARRSPSRRNNRTGTIADVEHIVFLMQENRSFDHYFGTMRGVRGFADPRAVTLPSGKSVWHQPNGSGELLPFRPDVQDLGMTFLPDPPHGWNDTHAAWNGGQLRSVGAEQGCGDHDLPHPQGPAVPVRAGRCVHDLRQLPLLADGPDRSQSLPHVDRLGRQRRRGRRSGHHQRRSRLRLVHLSRAPRARRHLLEGVPGRRRRPGRGRFLGLDRRRLHRQLRRQLAALLPPVSVRAARNAAGRPGAGPAPTSWRTTASRTG